MNMFFVSPDSHDLLESMYIVRFSQQSFFLPMLLNKPHILLMPALTQLEVIITALVFFNWHTVKLQLYYISEHWLNVHLFFFQENRDSAVCKSHSSAVCAFVSLGQVG